VPTNRIHHTALADRLVDWLTDVVRFRSEMQMPYRA